MVSNVVMMILLPVLAQAPPSPPRDVDAPDPVAWTSLSDSGDREDEARERAQEAKDREEEARERQEEAKERAREAEERRDEAYEEAQEAVEEEHWDQAIDRFDRVIQEKTKRSDAAFYWKAYAQAKRGLKTEALATLAALAKAYPNSRWLKDAKALEAELRGGKSAMLTGSAAGDEEKILALNALLNADSERAIPLLETLLQGNASPKVREKALFVLAQSGSSQARAVLVRIAKGQSNPDQQLKAVKYLGLFGSSESKQALAEIYAGSSEIALKKAVLQAFMVSGEKARVLAVAKTESSAELRRDAVRQLGVMGAQDELWELYRAESALENKKAMLQAFMVSGAKARVLAIAKTDSSPELRRDAVRQLGVMGAQEELWELYRTESSVENKKAILQGMFVGGNVDRMIELARTEKDPELRRAAVHNLGLMGGPRTAEALVSMYAGAKDREESDRVIQALFLQGNAKALVALGRKETDPQLRRDIVTKLSQMGSKDSIDFLMEIINK